MKKPGVRFALALFVLPIAEGQAMKDAVLPNPVRPSARLQLTVALDKAST